MVIDILFFDFYDNQLTEIRSADGFNVSFNFYGGTYYLNCIQGEGSLTFYLTED
jgi:hypothetical protein